MRILKDRNFKSSLFSEISKITGIVYKVNDFSITVSFNELEDSKLEHVIFSKYGVETDHHISVTQ